MITLAPVIRWERFSFQFSIFSLNLLKVVIDILNFQSGVEVKNWYPLFVSEKGGKASGEILVSVTFIEHNIPKLSQGEQFCPEEVLKTIRVGLSWDSFDPAANVDLDASAVCFDSSGKVQPCKNCL